MLKVRVMKQCTIEKLLVVHILSVFEAVWEWYRQTRDESKKPVLGLLIKEKAKHFHQEIRLHNNCAYSDGRLRGFKVRHGIRHLKLQNEKQKVQRNVCQNFRLCRMILYLPSKFITPTK